MTSLKAGDRGTGAPAAVLLVTLAGMIVLWLAGLSEVMWTPPFFAAVELGRRRGRRSCRGAAPHAK